MHRIIRAVLVLCCGLTAAACDIERITFGEARTGAVRLQPWLETDRLTYTAYYTRDTIELDIGFTFHNDGRVPVAIPRCVHPHRPVLDRLTGGRWHEVFTPVETCWAEPLVVGAGRSERFVFRVRAGRPHTRIEPQFRTSHVPGTYRLRWDLYEYDAFSQFRTGRRLPMEHRVSNEFRIVH
jgi:hypothetical protein